ncbi:MAG: cytochrome b [Alphaproteobacteria bacterium]
MALRNSSERWGAIAKTFHWLIAVLVFCMIVLGLWAVNAPLSPLKLQLFMIHKLTGLSIFVLMLLRLSWRLINPTPILPPSLVGLERLAAQTTHWVLYGLILLMPISGYVITSAANFPVSVFGLFEIPLIVPHDKDLQELGETIHVLSFYVLAMLLALHIAAALRHHFILKDEILKRML